MNKKLIRLSQLDSLKKAKAYLDEHDLLCDDTIQSCPGSYSQLFGVYTWTCSDCFDSFCFIDGYHLENEDEDDIVLFVNTKGLSFRNLKNQICPCANVELGYINGQELTLAIEELIEEREKEYERYRKKA